LTVNLFDGGLLLPSLLAALALAASSLTLGLTARYAKPDQAAATTSAPIPHHQVS
jgi:hypothetical protein